MRSDTPKSEYPWKVSREKALDIIGMKRGDRAYPVEIIDKASQRILISSIFEIWRI
jgi:hypothetical protein